ncbi:hypothetical protein CORC01_02414 [Colletotrichum orchidophilum]|uniref:Uncharacterized protein n=1 Tax=Colletotrichum orchidophilum TaxID=1209926 RepID=A0A1G4BLW0_9PEZI|nr:uncharacterized protein CORC01_02414 [Colletotrichum orchidophilum]OHF02421.1 hypothetical protein CORC01_02414 [Colletotrichum orchidophilum]
MEMTLEAIIAIVALIVGSPPTCFIIWRSCIRRRERSTQAIIPLYRPHTITNTGSPHYGQSFASYSIWKSRTMSAFEMEMNRPSGDEHASWNGWSIGSSTSYHLGGHHV